MKARLSSIAESEGCSVRDEQLDAILALAQGDMRRAVTTLQSAHTLGGTLTQDSLAELAGLPPPTVVDGVWNSMNSFQEMQKAIDNVCAEGFSASSLLVALSNKIIPDPTLSDMAKAKLSIRIAEAEKNLIDGADEYLQLMTVGSMALTCFQESRMAKP